MIIVSVIIAQFFTKSKQLFIRGGLGHFCGNESFDSGQKIV